MYNEDICNTTCQIVNDEKQLAYQTAHYLADIQQAN